MSDQIKHEEECGGNVQMDESWIHNTSFNVSGMTEANAAMDGTMSMMDESWIHNTSFNVSGMTEANSAMEGTMLMMDKSWIHNTSFNVSGMTEANSAMEGTMSMMDESWIHDTSFNVSGKTLANEVMEETMSMMDDFRGMLEANNDKSLLENQICEFIDMSISTPPPSSNARKLVPPQIYMPECNDTSSRDDVSTVEWFANSAFDEAMIEDETFVWDDLPAVDEELINVPP